MAKDPRSESVLKRLGVSFTYEPELAIDTITREKSHQVRNDANLAPATEVKKYQQLLTAGADFPPILVTKLEHAMIDGNTRTEAFRAAKRQVIPAYLCDIKSPRVGRTLAIAINAQAGNRMNKGEIVEWVRGLNGDLPSDDEFTLFTGYNPRMLKRIIQARNFDERTTRLAIKTPFVFPDTTKILLQAIDLDAVFVELTRLIGDAGLESGDVRDLVKVVSAATTQEEKLQIIAARREALSIQIEERRAGLPGRLSAVARYVNMHCGWLIANAPTGGLDDPNTDTRAATQEKLATTVESLQFVLRTQYGMDA